MREAGASGARKLLAAGLSGELPCYVDDAYQTRSRDRVSTSEQSSRGVHAACVLRSTVVVPKPRGGFPRLAHAEVLDGQAYQRSVSIVDLDEVRS